MALKLIPGGIFTHIDGVCPACEGARCDKCRLEGTHTAFKAREWAEHLRFQLDGISDAHLSELAVNNALDFTRNFRSLQARYVAGFLEEVLRRAGLLEKGVM